jgi:ABC-type transporter MlaC component
VADAGSSFEGVAEESNQNNVEMKNVTDKEISAFHVRFCPFADRLYRSTLIVTGNPRSAEQLQVDVYLKAFVEYLHAGHLANFEI